MAVDNLLARLITMFGKGELSKTLAQYDPPSRDDILHDGLVGAGKTWGGILGTAAGIAGGEAVGGPYGAAAGAVTLASAGSLAGGWAAHGADLQGLLINDILTHPENWTIDAAGAIIPAVPEIAKDPPRQNASPSSAFDRGAPPLQHSPAPNAGTYGIPVSRAGVRGTESSKPVPQAAVPWDLASKAPQGSIVDAPAIRRSDVRRLTRRDAPNEADVFTSGAAPVPYLPYR